MIIAQGGGYHFLNITQYEDYFAEGDRGRLTIELRWFPVTASDINKQFEVEGIQAKAKVMDTTLIIDFVKGLPILAAVLGVILSLIALLLVSRWTLEKIEEMPLTKLAFPAIIVASLAVGLWALRK